VEEEFLFLNFGYDANWAAAPKPETPVPIVIDRCDADIIPKNPQDTKAPKVIYQCAQVQFTVCNQKENHLTRTIFVN